MMKWLYAGIVLFAVLMVGMCSHQPFHAMLLALLLVLLEVSLSFDNAVINARILRQMAPQWQRRFMTWGIVIAVVVIRLLLPILIVYTTSHLTLLQVWHYALHRPELYQQALEHAFPYIAAFGGGFLLMVWLSFMHETKSTYWVAPIERLRCWSWPGFAWAIILIVSIVYALLQQAVFLGVLVLLGAGLQYALLTLSTMMRRGVSQLATLGLAGFLYLECVDASFSLDGVIGAFAITHNIVIITVGLGCGALVMRAFTVYCVKHEVMNRWRYLEHGAHYALALLAVLILVKAFIAVPEWLTGLISIGLIGVSLLASYRADQRV